MFRFLNTQTYITYDERTGEVCDRVCRADALTRKTLDQALRSGWRLA